MEVLNLHPIAVITIMSQYAYLVWERAQGLATHSVCIEVREQLVKSQYRAQLTILAAGTFTC